MHDHGPTDGRRLAVSFLATSLFVAAEAAAALWANSLALLTDAGHNLADALALAVSWYAARVARRPADSRRTFGYHRAGVLAALANTLSLVGIAFYILVEGGRRLFDPQPVEAGPMIVAALAAVVLNVLISLWLRGEAAHDLNVRSAYLHMVGDAVSALGVAAAGVVVALTGSPLADPVASLLIAGFILWTAWPVLKESVDVLMEAAPAGADADAVAAAAGRVPGVEGVHDVHVWAVASGRTACSLHVRAGPGLTLLEGQQLQAKVAEALSHGFGIGHATIQVEVEGCGADGVACTVRPAESHEGHSH